MTIEANPNPIPTIDDLIQAISTNLELLRLLDANAQEFGLPPSRTGVILTQQKELGFYIELRDSVPGLTENQAMGLRAKVIKMEQDGKH